ncbi:TolC family outer membrane protein [Paraburkholderia tagetis]|uniref:TolC family outer membrane protein n=1 Tax=Paraburkholderia tagetis TaxID=2913261 RepID=A0A9X1UKE0_9BURK|nr:TolC family outer membrane protein [Paraburkholderia tagetis]MCG5073631.1 TolC family outer membrane protein [Paraburkholderia tagetis]
MSSVSPRRVIRALALACLLLASGARAADLLSVVDDALDHDPALAASHAASRAAAQAVPKARAGLLPRVTGGWGRAYNGVVTEDFPTQHYWQSGWQIGLTQPVFNWANWTAYRQADYEVLRARLQTANATQDAILAAAQAYFDALAAADEVARATDYLRALDAHLALVVRAKAAGEATLIDVQDGEASRAQAQLQLLDAQSQARLARAALERLSGKPAQTLAPLPPGGAPTLQPADVEPWVTQAQTHGYAVQIGEVALQIAKFDTEKARAERYPTVDLQVTHTPAGAAGGYARPTTTTTGMLAVTIPLFAGGEITAKVDEASALEDKARDELDAAVRDSGAGARNAWLRVTSGKARVSALEQVVLRAQTALDATRIGFGVGSRTSLDVLRATDTLYSSRRDLIRARYESVLALLKLLSQTATLDLDEVGRINAQLFVSGGAQEREQATRTAVAAAGQGGERGQPQREALGSKTPQTPPRPIQLPIQRPIHSPMQPSATASQTSATQVSVPPKRDEAMPPQSAAATPQVAPRAARMLSAADMAPATPVQNNGYVPLAP